jgi:lysozyme
MTTQRKTLVAVIGTVAAAVAIAFTGHKNEGKSNAPYQDSSGVWTVCYGQTGVPMHYYTNAQCDAMLGNTLASYADQIDAQMPTFAQRTDGQKVAALDLAYNIGVNAFLRSTLAKRYRAGDFPAACDGFLAYKYVGETDCSARSSNCYGVWQRRQAERSMCLGNVH